MFPLVGIMFTLPGKIVLQSKLFVFTIVMGNMFPLPEKYFFKVKMCISTNFKSGFSTGEKFSLTKVYKSNSEEIRDLP